MRRLGRPLPLALLALLALLLGTACSSVSLPEENYYRIVMPAPEAWKPGDRILRVEGLEVHASLSSDRLLVAQEPVRLQAYEFHRWISPLDRLVRDALIVGLKRSKAFQEVKGPMDPPGEGDQLLLSGRVLDFHQVASEGRWAALVTLELRLAAAEDDRVLLQEEFSRTVLMAENSPTAVVQALSHGMAQIMDNLLLRCVDAGLLQAASMPGK